MGANPKIFCAVVVGFAGEPPPTEEQERKRLSRLRLLRFLASLLIAYSVSFDTVFCSSNLLLAPNSIMWLPFCGSY